MAWSEPSESRDMAAAASGISPAGFPLIGPAGLEPEAFYLARRDSGWRIERLIQQRLWMP